MFFSQLKSPLGSASLSVRQEHLTLMRVLATDLPLRFPDLALLASPEVQSTQVHTTSTVVLSSSVPVISPLFPYSNS